MLNHIKNTDENSFNNPFIPSIILKEGADIDIIHSRTTFIFDLSPRMYIDGHEVKDVEEITYDSLKLVSGKSIHLISYENDIKGLFQIREIKDYGTKFYLMVDSINDIFSSLGFSSNDILTVKLLIKNPTDYN